MFKIVKKLWLTTLLFGEIWPFLGTFFIVHFSEKYTSDEAQTKIKTLFKAERTFFEPFKKNDKNSLKSSES